MNISSEKVISLGQNVLTISSEKCIHLGQRILTISYEKVIHLGQRILTISYEKVIHLELLTISSEFGYTCTYRTMHFDSFFLKSY